MAPNLFLTKLAYLSFNVETLVDIKLLNDGDEIGLCYMGSEYSYICIKRIDGQNHLQVKKGYFNNELDEVVFDSIYKNNEIKLQMKFKEPGIYKLGFNNTIFKETYNALPGRWIGGKIGIYAKGKKTGGYGLFKYFKVREVK